MNESVLVKYGGSTLYHKISELPLTNANLQNNFYSKQTNNVTTDYESYFQLFYMYNVLKKLTRYT